MNIQKFLPGFIRKKLRELQIKSDFQLDIEKVKLITDSGIEDLKKVDYLEKLIPKLGLNKEVLNEQPKIVKENGGGLLIWQYPNQFSKYLALLQKQKINSYLEIGCRWGGTFILTNEYLKRFGDIKKSLAIDIIDSPVQKYCLRNKETEFWKTDSKSHSFKKYMENNFFDLVLIDGDHSYEGVKNDYEYIKDRAKIVVLHDIVNNAAEGVVKFWNELKKDKEKYDFFEFKDQYEEVVQKTGSTFLGIGVAIKK
tara:strand:+ start:628 stop:1386 length:759 start_codon:yes stop_codon:yes gene_type:complete